MYVGIDAAEIVRFKEWHKKPFQQLNRIFSIQEIAYCLNNDQLSAQRFAARFAAKEALYKVLTQLSTALPPFFTVCSASSLEHLPSGVPCFTINWERLDLIASPITVSITHTHAIAVAIVFLSESMK
ncbi:MAG: 4'-phosphopantetheinyl transferase superfamily protein [Candidatus Babeliaceae bacterium]